MLKYSYKVYSDSDILYDDVVSFDELERVFKSFLLNLRYCATGFSVSQFEVSDENKETHEVFCVNELPF